MKKEPRWTVYCHTHVASGRRYVGLTKKTMLARWNQHSYNARQKKGKKCSYFWAAIRKYGPESFSHEILKSCGSLEEASAAEIRYIEEFGSKDREKGFNLMKGGSRPVLDKKSYSELRSSLALEHWKDPRYRTSVVSSMTATKNLPENRAMASKRAKALWADNAFREKVTASNKLTDPSIRAKAVDAMKVSFSTPESLKKRSDASKKAWKSGDLLARQRALREDPDYASRVHSGLSRGASLNRLRTHCKRGHEFTPENTYINKRGSRVCRHCKRLSWASPGRRLTMDP
jgi:hypothetical protein